MLIGAARVLAISTCKIIILNLMLGRCCFGQVHEAQNIQRSKEHLGR